MFGAGAGRRGEWGKEMTGLFLNKAVTILLKEEAVQEEKKEGKWKGRRRGSWDPRVSLGNHKVWREDSPRRQYDNLSSNLIRRARICCKRRIYSENSASCCLAAYSARLLCTRLLLKITAAVSPHENIFHWCSAAEASTHNKGCVWFPGRRLFGWCVHYY